jgi:inosine-uridine nucleoside N-ribohydrolase
MPSKPIPVILDTDIGDDIDDLWALVMLLRSPELDVQLITASINNTHLKARMVAKTLALAGRTDIPIGVGVKSTEDASPQAPWVADYELADYPGAVDEDAAGAIVRAVMDAPTPITLIAIGPLTTVAEALRREPGIAGRVNFVAMAGRFSAPHGEYNVKRDAAASQAVFAAPWATATTTPIDSCAQVVLRGERYARLRDSHDPVMQEVIAAYRIWSEHCEGFRGDPNVESSTLFDTVGIFLAWSTEHLAMERFGVRITDEGVTLRDDAAAPFNVAMDWTNLAAYKDFLVERMLAPTQ